MHKNASLFCCLNNIRTWKLFLLIAPAGHPSAQAPHSMHVSASITYCPSPSLIAPAGQVPSQAPQEIQASEITYAIVISSLYK